MFTVLACPGWFENLKRLHICYCARLQNVHERTGQYCNGLPMRIICAIALVLGLFLSGFSSLQIAKARKHQEDVEEVRAMVLELDLLHRSTAPKSSARLQSPSIESMLQPLNAAATFERSWWTVAIAGAAVFVVGAFGLIIESRRPERKTGA